VNKYVLFVLILFYLSSSFAHTQKLASPFMLNYEQMEVKTLKYKGSKVLSKILIDIKKEPSPESNIFFVTKKGQGHIDKYDNASWIIEARLRNNNGFLETLDNVCRIKDQKGRTLVVYKKLYDYEKKVIIWESYDSNGKLNKKKFFPIKGKTCDDTTLIFFLKAFMPNITKEGQFFYFLTNEPKLYKSKIKFINNEKLKLGSREVNTTKIKLTADIGILDDVLDKFVPKTFMWYSDTPPYSWMKYQGFEKDSNSHYVVKSLESRNPIFTEQYESH